MPSTARPDTLVLLVAAALTACGPASGDTAGDTDTTATAGDTDTTAADTPTTAASDDPTGEPGDTDTDTTGEAPPQLACGGASWATPVEPGEFLGVAADSRGHAIGFGTSQTSLTFPDALIVDLGPDGAPSHRIGAGAPGEYDSVGGSGVDGDDNVYALVNEGLTTEDGLDTRFWLRKFDTGGALVGELDLGTASQGLRPYDLAVAPDGSVVITSLDPVDHDVVTRRGPDFAVLWEVNAPALHVHAVNAAGTSVALRSRDGVVKLGADGQTEWDLDWPLWNPGAADLDDLGNVVVAGTAEDGAPLTVARFDPDGTLAWETKFTLRNQYDQISDVAVNAAGTVAVAGYTQTDGWKAFALRLDAAGEIVEQHHCDEPESRGEAIALDEAGRMFLAGILFQDGAENLAYVAAFE